MPPALFDFRLHTAATKEIIRNFRNPLEEEFPGIARNHEKAFARSLEKDLVGFYPKISWQANRLAASVLEYLCNGHDRPLESGIYQMISSPWEFSSGSICGWIANHAEEEMFLKAISLPCTHFLVLLLLPAVATAADNWPGFRGPTGQGSTD